MTQNQQVATRPQQGQQQAVPSPNQLAQAFTNSMLKAWTPAIKDIMPPDKFARIMLTAINGSPKVQDALKTETGKASLMKATMQSAQTGLVPDGYEAHLVPFNNKNKNGVEIQFIPDYKGLIKLMWNSNQIASIRPEVVCEKDQFSWRNGVIEHVIDWFNPRGEAKLWYVIVTLKNGGIVSKIMNRNDIEAIRARSKSKDNGPWVTDYNAMALKTVIKNISKLLPRSPELQHAIDVDNENDFPQLVDVTPKPSRFDTTAQVPSGGLLGAIAGEQPVGQNAKEQNVPQNHPAAPQDADAAINQALAEKQAPVSYNQIREWYETENGKWDPADVLANLDAAINRTLDYVESTNQQ